MDQPAPAFDEMLRPDGGARRAYSDYAAWFEGQQLAALRKKADEADAVFRRTGITFNVYGANEAEERLIPFDIVPRIIGAKEWSRLSRGIEQRVRAINAFLHDIYHRQEIIRAGRRDSRRLPRRDRAPGQGKNVQKAQKG